LQWVSWLASGLVPVGPGERWRNTVGKARAQLQLIQLLAAQSANQQMLYRIQQPL